MHEQEGGHHHTDFDRDGEVEHDGEQKGDQQHGAVSRWRAQQLTEAVHFAHVPGDEEQYPGERGQWNVAHQRGGEQHEAEQEDRVQHAGDRCTRTGAHIGRRACQCARGRQPGDKRRRGVGHALGDEFGVRPVAATGHAIGDDCRQQRFHASQEGDGQRRRQQLGGSLERDVWNRELGKCGGQISERAADGRHGRFAERAHQRGGHDPDQQGGQAGSPAAQADHEKQRAQTQAEGPEIGRADVFRVKLPTGQKLARQLVDRQAEQILDLAGEDRHRNAGSEAGDHRLRHVLDQRAETKQSGQNQDQSGEQRAQNESAVAEALDHPEHDRDERGRWPADLYARATERRNEKTSDDRGVQAFVRRGARRDRQRHCQRKRHHRDGQAGHGVLAQALQGVAAP